MIVFADKFDAFVQKNIQSTHVILLHGTATDAIRRASQKILSIVLGTPIDHERLDDLTAAQIKSDPASLDESIRARSFFPGRRVVQVIQATDSIAPLVTQSIAHIVPQDTLLLISAGKLAKNSKLRRALELDRHCIATPMYEETLSHIQIQKRLQDLELNTESDLTATAQQLATLPAAQVDQTLDIIKLASLDTKPINLETYLPKHTEIEFFEVIQSILLRNAAETLQHTKLLMQRRQPLVTLVILLTRDLQALLNLKTLPQQAAEQKLRSSYFGERQKVMRSSLHIWTQDDLSKTLQDMHKIDAALRSSTHVNTDILLLRSLMKICKKTT